MIAIGLGLKRAVRIGRFAGVVLLGVVLVGLVGVAPSLAARSPWWLVQSGGEPSYLAPGGAGTIRVTVENVGDAGASGASVPVTVTDTLPEGLEVTAITGGAGTGGSSSVGGTLGTTTCEVASMRSVSCTWRGEEGHPLEPYVPIEAEIAVKVARAAVSGESEISVSGGQTQGTEAAVPSLSVDRPVTVSATATPFGGAGYALIPEEEGGLPDTQAGSHPFQQTNTFTLNQTADPLHPPAQARNLSFNLPAGLIGNPTVTPRCTMAQFLTFPSAEYDLCPDDTAVGVANVTIVVHLGAESAAAPLVEAAPLFNLVPVAGEPARFGFVVEGVPVVLDTAVRTGGDYGLTVTSSNTSQAASLLSARVTFWGVPGDPRHDSSRGYSCINGSQVSIEGGGGGLIPPCTPLAESQPRPLLTLPTSCTGALQSTLGLTSWPSRVSPEGFAPEPLSMSEPGVSLTGCERLQFAPELSVTPDAQAAASPTGLGVDVHIPQLESAGGLAEGNLKKAVVTLPPGMTINPAGANGLGACSPEQVGLDNASPVTCPESAKVGTAEAVSPAVHSPLTGSVYVAEQGDNPFGSLLALYLVVEGEGVLVKSAGEVHLDPTTGQVTTTFDNVPQQATSDIRLHFFGGPHAPLSTPAGCGTYTTTSRLTPYNTTIPAEPSSGFQVTSGPNGTGCGPQSFAPAFTAGTVNNQAGAFSPFNVAFSRQDQDQSLGGLTLTTPPGLLGILKSVALCGEPQAAQGTCGAGSLIGHATTTAGAGPDPVAVSGQVFLTGPYKGAPFGLSIVVPAAVGPFNLGNVVVRAAVSVDPHTAQITVTSDPFPTILQGIPLQIRSVNVSIDRAGFIFNPTNCEPLTIGGTLSSTQGASTAVSSHFQAANCGTLPFKPAFTVSTQAATSKKNGASLLVKGVFPAGEANIRSVAVTLPKQLPARLTTIQQACPEAVFNANPASCPAGSNIGTGTAVTPILAGPVMGPAYLVSHGGAAFPDLVAILQGEGVTIDLTGSIDIKHNVTSSTFASIPDAPITSFQLALPEGPHSGLAAVVPAGAKGNLCSQALSMPFTITGQNGVVVKQNTKIAVTGCPRAKKKAKVKRRAGKKR